MNAEIEELFYCQLCHHWWHIRGCKTSVAIDDKIGIRTVLGFQRRIQVVGFGSHDCVLHVAGLVVNYGISNTIVLEIP